MTGLVHRGDKKYICPTYQIFRLSCQCLSKGRCQKHPKSEDPSFLRGRGKGKPYSVITLLLLFFVGYILFQIFKSGQSFLFNFREGFEEICFKKWS